MLRPKHEVADIFRRYGPDYRTDNKLFPKQHQVMSDIEHCRTNYFGYHVDIVSGAVKMMCFRRFENVCVLRGSRTLSAATRTGLC